MKNLKLRSKLLTISLLIFVALIATFSNKETECKVTQEALGGAVDKSINFLERKQQDSVSFEVEVSYSRDMKNSTIDHNSIYPAAFVLHSLKFAEGSKSNKIKEKIISYLLDNEEQGGIWRYLGKDNKLLPPSTELIVFVPAVLKENNIVVNTSVLEYISKFRTKEGIFYVWPTEDVWFKESNSQVNDELYSFLYSNEIDEAVNAVILFAYSLFNEPLPEVSEFLNNFIKTEEFRRGTAYFPSPNTFIYFFTRAYYDGGATTLNESLNSVVDYILEIKKNDSLNEIENCMVTVSLLNSRYKGAEVCESVNSIIKTQKEDGGWPTNMFYRGPKPLTKGSYYGSEDITTSICLEALLKYKIGNSNIS